MFLKLHLDPTAAAGDAIYTKPRMESDSVRAPGRLLQKGERFWRLREVPEDLWQVPAAARPSGNALVTGLCTRAAETSHLHLSAPPQKSRLKGALEAATQSDAGENQVTAFEAEEQKQREISPSLIPPWPTQHIPNTYLQDAGRLRRRR